MPSLVRSNRPRCLCLSLLLLSGLTACSGKGGTPSGAAGEPLRQLAVAEDINPDPHIVEINLTAAKMQYEFVAGQPTTVWAYNGSLPGPLIECNQGDELVVHFTNQLAHETTVHWHGIRLPANMDGSHLSQPPVPPGGTFTYRFTVPDAALFWYHPHHMAQEQLYRGLYGPLLVRGATEPQMTEERILVLSDIGLDANGQVMPPMELAMSQLDRAMGVVGNTVLINGQRQPRIDMRPQGRERWRIVNAAGARPFDLQLAGQQLTLIGTDGGLLNAPASLSHLLLVPGERADLVIDAPANPVQLVAAEHMQVKGDMPMPPVPAVELATVAVADDPVTTPALPANLGQVPPLDPGSPVRRIQFNAALAPAHDSPEGMQPGPGFYQFLINGLAFPDVPPFTVKQGAVELWDIENHSFMEHPFHIHGMRFQVLNIDGVPPAFGGWKDTINLPLGTAELVTSRTRLLVSFDGEPGDWVYHCHVLFHQENGMMAEFMVEP
jgi:FtsP/CotA-like multicopper oxidase with cupredoxin domain